MINPIGYNIYNQHLNPGRPQGSASLTLPNTGVRFSNSDEASGSQKFIPSSDQKGLLLDTFDEKVLKQLEIVPCETCANRVYQDGSNDPGVSFKSPTHISPEQSGVMVASHEQEHVSHESAKAASEDRVVVSQSVRMYNGVCPECGKTYVAGGETRTITAKKQPDPAETYKGNLVDLKL